MDAFILESLTGTGWKLSGDAYWTLDTAKARAARIIAKNHAKRVRILPVTVSDTAVAEYPDEPEPAYITRFREVAADDSVAAHARAAIREALDRYDTRGAVS